MTPTTIHGTESRTKVGVGMSRPPKRVKKNLQGPGILQIVALEDRSLRNGQQWAGFNDKV